MDRSRSPIRSLRKFSGSGNEIAIKDMPQLQYNRLCEHLDGLKEWKHLARLMMLRADDILNIERGQNDMGSSPTDLLLQVWGIQYSHTVSELFILLGKRKLHEAMRIIKDSVERKYHFLIPSSMPQLTALIPGTNRPATARNGTSEKILNCSIPSSDVNCSSSSANESTTKGNASTFLSVKAVKNSVSTIEINYNELAEATNNWSESLRLGKGGFGTVYRGNWKHTDVAIKQLQYSGSNGRVQLQQSLTELRYLSECRHDNVLPLYGYSLNGEKPCLVYQLMKGGSLEDRLYSRKYGPLTWEQRMFISVGTARGINYLHTFRNKPIIHGDIKPANVLLDQCLHPKIGDFGLAREGPLGVNSAVVVTQIYGTKPYLPPEFLRLKKLSTQVDTYSFGIMLLETFTGLHVYDKNRPKSMLTDHIWDFFATPGNRIVDLIDKMQATNDTERDMCESIITLGWQCIAQRPEGRPDMELVLSTIERLQNFYNESMRPKI